MGWNGAHALVTQFEKRKKLVAGPATTRCGHTFKPCDVLCVKISHGIRTTSAVLDDEIRLPRSWRTLELSQAAVHKCGAVVTGARATSDSRRRDTATE